MSTESKGFTPFASGYAEAILKDGVVATTERLEARGHLGPWTLSDFSDEARARIVADCEAHERAFPLLANDPRRAGRGAWFWKNRQVGMWTKAGWPPLTPSLNPEGKVTFDD